MKKTILLLALTGVLFMACKKEKKKDDNPVKKLPVMIIESWDDRDGDTVYLTYDANHRLIKLNTPDNSTNRTLSYDSDEELIRIHSNINSYYSSNTFSYSGNTITKVDSSFYNTPPSVSTSTFSISDKKQLLRIDNQNSSDYSYNYDANGSITQCLLEDGGDIFPTTFTPSTSVKGVFRYSNTPDWFFTYWYEGTYPKNGYMPINIQDENWSSSIDYQTDNDGYVTTLTDIQNNGHTKKTYFSYQTIQ